MSAEFQKPASAMERLFVVYNDVRSPFAIQFVLEGEGEPTAEELDRALAESTAANPGACIVLSEFQERWEMGPGPPLKVVEADTIEDGQAFLLGPLSPYTGPTSEILFVRGERRSHFVFRTLHATMDGRGTLNWAEDFMRCLRGEAPKGNPSTADQDTVMHVETHGEVRYLPPQESLHPFGKVRWMNKSGEFRWVRHTFDTPLRPGLLGELCHALARSARSTGAEGPVRFNVPADLRRYCPEERSTGNLVSGLIIEVTPEMTPADINFQIVRELYQKREAYPLDIYAGLKTRPIALVRAGAYTAFATEHNKGVYVFSSMLSHLGNLSSEDFAAPSFTPTGAYFVPPFAEWASYLCVNGFDERTEITLGLPVTYTKKREMARFEDLIHSVIMR